MSDPRILPVEPNAVNLRIGSISVGAAFQPRSNDFGVGATSFRGWKATPTRNSC